MSIRMKLSRRHFAHLRAIAKLNDAVVSTLADPIIRLKLSDQSMELLPRQQQTPEALGLFHKAEIEKWWPIIKAAGIKGE
jgi:hypothetical protein